MFDERLLARALPRPAQETSTRALDEIMHLAQSAKYEPAAERAAELIDAGCKDIRAFIIYALGLFAERGPASLPASFGSITALLSTRSAELTSLVESRTMDTAFRFGFRTLRAHLDFDERRPEVERRSWAQHLTPSVSASVLRACSELRAAIHAVVAEPLCDAELGAVIARLEAYCARNAPEPLAARTLPNEVAASPPAPVSALLASEAPPSAAPAAPVAEPPASSEPAFARRASDHDTGGDSLPIAPALRQFIRKLEAFEHLVTNGRAAKAAIVANDIREVIAAFDPLIYLPHLLAPYFRLMSYHVEELAPYWEQGGTPSWQALEQLYKVDLDAFVEA